MSGKTLLVAEKPSQAEIYVQMVERNVGGEKFAKKSGYFESANYYITWCFGHLLGLPLPGDYDKKYREKGTGFKYLPILLEDLSRLPYKFTDKSKEDRGHLICELASQCDTVICATDPDREGQGIFSRLFGFYKMERPKMLRLWAKSLTDSDLDKSWSSMKDLSEYKNLADACTGRTLADWEVGMTGSRAAAAVTGEYGLSVGRVQTTVLRMIVDRDKEVEGYKESFYYQLRGKWAGIKFLYCRGKETKFESESDLQSVLKMLEGRKFKLKEFSEAEGIKNPPHPFNIADLQKAANKELKLPLKKTDALLQDLYEWKLVTYPRTDSSCMPESDLAIYHGLVRELADADQRKYLVAETVKPDCVKNTESAHTAIAPTGVSVEALKSAKKEEFTKDHLNLYELIKNRLIVSFMASNRYLQYKLEIEEDRAGEPAAIEWAEPAVFRASVKVNLERGYLDYVALLQTRGLKQEEESDEQGEAVEEMSERLNEEKLRGLLAGLDDMDLPRIKRSKPKYYIGATLVTAMQKCGKDVINPKYKKMLSETQGIGTPATQSSFPDTLKDVGYIVEEDGSYRSTEKGRKLIEEVMPFKLKTPEITAEMELQLKLVECGELSLEEFCRGFGAFCKEFTEDMRPLVGKVVWPWAEKRGEDTGLKCRKCGGAIFETESVFVCENRKSVKNEQGTYDYSGCEFIVYKKFRGKDNAVNRKMLEKLFRGEQVKVSGLVSKAGKKYDIMVYLDDKSGKLESAVGGEVKKLDLKCKFCGSPMVENDSGFACCGERAKCGFVIYKNGSPNVTEAVVRELFLSGETRDKIDGFVSVKKGGKVFPARLRLNCESKKVEYVFN